MVLRLKILDDTLKQTHNKTAKENTFVLLGLDSYSRYSFCDKLHF